MQKRGPNDQPTVQSNSRPLPIIFGFGAVTILALQFYLSYAATAWFLQDDFKFLARYSDSLQWGELLDFSNFGRFLSRNVYWHLGEKFFSTNAQMFYTLNLGIILSTCYIIFKIFEEHGNFAGKIAALFYFTLPGTVHSYSWISNSQHLLGHLLVLIFVYRFAVPEREALDRTNERSRATQLGLILLLGFSSNIFMTMVVTLPMYMIAARGRSRISKSTYFTAAFGGLLCVVFLLKLARNHSAAYSASYNLETFHESLIFYFGSSFVGLLWIVSIILGFILAHRRRNHLTAWFFLASGLFFLPFAFLVHQRYEQYGTLTHLFLILGLWKFLLDAKLTKRPVRAGSIGLLVAVFLFAHASATPIRYFTENPFGVKQRDQIAMLKEFVDENPEVENFCFRSNRIIENQTGVREWDLPREWWFVGFGEAFTLFVSPEKKYRLLDEGIRCDVVFVWNDEDLKLDPR